jgi:hypothetical protein
MGTLTMHWPAGRRGRAGSSSGSPMWPREALRTHVIIRKCSIVGLERRRAGLGAPAVQRDRPVHATPQLRLPRHARAPRLPDRRYMHVTSWALADLGACVVARSSFGCVSGLRCYVAPLSSALRATRPRPSAVGPQRISRWAPTTAARSSGDGFGPLVEGRLGSSRSRGGSAITTCAVARGPVLRRDQPPCGLESLSKRFAGRARAARQPAAPWPPASIAGVSWRFAAAQPNPHSSASLHGH